MGEAGIPEEVRRFIHEHIDSLDQLEVLLLLRADPAREWSAAEVSRELRNDVSAVTERLSDMSHAGLMVASSGEELRYRYLPKTEQLACVVDQLAEAYAVRRVTVVTLIFSKPSKHVLSFADAFKLWREKKDG